MKSHDMARSDSNRFEPRKSRLFGSVALVTRIAVLIVGSIVPLAVLIGCSGGGGGSASALPSTPTDIGFSQISFATTTPAWPGWCKSITASFKDSAGASAAANSNVSLGVTASSSDVYTDSACTTTVSSLSIPSGSSSLTFYYKPNAVSSSLTLSLSHSAISTASYTGTSALPQASVLRGQTDYTTGNANDLGLSTGGLNEPRRIAIAGSKLIVADRANHRVLIYPSLTATTPDVVLGQVDLTSNSGVNPASSSSFADPVSVWSDGTQLLVTCRSQNRVLLWNSIPTSDATPADVVIGQTNDTDTLTGSSTAQLDSPEHAFIGTSKLFILDGGNSRVLIFNAVPGSTGASADVQIGAFGSGGAPDQFGTPYFALLNSGKLLVADGGTNHRIQVFNSVPIANGASADLSLSLSNTSANPTSLAIVGSKLLAYDADKSRTVFWNSIPTASTTPDGVIGQADLVTVSTTIDSATIGQSYGLLADGNKLWIADTERHRLLQFTTPEP